MAPPPFPYTQAHPPMSSNTANFVLTPTTPTYYNNAAEDVCSGAALNTPAID